MKITKIQREKINDFRNAYMQIFNRTNDKSLIDYANSINSGDNNY